MKKYYFPEHEATYQQIKELGLVAWDQFHNPELYDFDNFMMRPFLEQALNLISLDTKTPQALEYGCGTGTGACFLAARGFEVEAFDISATAIELAQKNAAERGMSISFAVKDITDPITDYRLYDLILDNYCLQSVVTDNDRQQLFANVRQSLKSSGFYIIASAVYNPERDYSGSYFDAVTGIVYEQIDIDQTQYQDSVLIKNSRWLPNRRHLTAEALRNELLAADFRIIYQDGGNLICILKKE